MIIKNESSSRMTIYEGILEGAINDVCQRIGFDPNTVVWVIYSVDDSKLIPPLVPDWLINCNSQRKNQWGYCEIAENKKTIYISTKAIIQSKYALPNKCSLGFEKKRSTHDTLTDVLLDEITHIQTRRDHGSPAYDRQYQNNCCKYCGQYKIY